MSLRIHLLGRPRLVGPDGLDRPLRGRKAWAVLAYLLLGQHPPSRATLAGLLFGAAEDPLRALRWSLAEVRRGLDADGTLSGDPLRLDLAEDAQVDVRVLTSGRWTDAVALAGLGSELLEGFSVEAAGFESWLISQRHHVAAATEAVLHEAALGSLAAQNYPAAIDYGVRAAACSPLDENHQVLLIRLYRLAGRPQAARAQYAAWSETLRAELGVEPSQAATAALTQLIATDDPVRGHHAIMALVEAGSSAVTAGAFEAGITSLRTATLSADAAADDALRVQARLALAEALIHARVGLDEEGIAALHEADAIAVAASDLACVAHARSELGYVEFLRARYDRAHRWLADARRLAANSPVIEATAVTYLGCVASDRGDYDTALDLLSQGATLARTVAATRREAYALSMIGRLYLLRGDPQAARAPLESAIDLAAAEHWLAFVPWPQALLGEAMVATGEIDTARRILEQAFARACQLADPCWEGIAARALALLTDAEGDPHGALDLLIDARARGRRDPDPYVWLEAHTLEAMCAIGRRIGHPQAAAWVGQLWVIAARAGMAELMARALRHSAALITAGGAPAPGWGSGRGHGRSPSPRVG